MRHTKKTRRLRVLVPVLTAGLGAAALAALPAEALNTVTGSAGETWTVHDKGIPGLDTGSVTSTATRALYGYGGLRLHVQGGTSRLNDILLRGFGLTYDGRDTFTTTQGVDVDGVVAQRELVVEQGQNYGRFLDSFTNTTLAPVTVDVAFGGQLGNGTGTNQTAIAGTSSGDAALTAADGWASWYSPSAGPGSASFNGPSATVSGTPGTAGATTRVGNFLRNPFVNDLAASGEEANHPAFMTRVVIAPGATTSLVHYVVTGLPESRAFAGGGPLTPGSQVSAVQTVAQSLLDAPSVAGLSRSALCSVANFSRASLGITDADCTTGIVQPVQGDVADAVQAETVPTTSTYDPIGKTITQQLDDIRAGRTNSTQVVRAYLDRIAAYDRGPFGLHSVLDVAPDAMAQARAADRARAAGDTRPLLGVPILAKDIIDTKDMPTTGGSLQFNGWTPRDDAWQVKKLREAGAIILGKANLSRFAFSGHFSESHFGQVWNAFDNSKSSIGSSGGSAVSVASSFGAAALGTQTGDSLWGPSWGGSLFSLRGTDGMESSAGVMPLTVIQDYVGMIAQSPGDLALLLNAAARDNPDDVLDDVSNGRRPADWSASLDASSLRGKVVGVPAGAFTDPFGTTETSSALRARFSVFQQAGATMKEIPAAPPAPPRGNFGNLGREGWIQWFAAHPDAPVSLQDVSPGTGGMTEAQQRAFEAWRASYRELLASWMDTNGVDVVVYPQGLSDIHLNDSSGNSFGRLDPQGSSAGVPNMILPAGTNSHGTPIGFQLQGKAFQDAELLGYAYAFDQIAHGRQIPSITPALTYDADAIPNAVGALEPVTTPGTPATPAAARPTVLDTRVRATVAARGPARAALSIGCASSETACTVAVRVRFGARTITTRTVVVPAGERRAVPLRLRGRAKARLLDGRRVRLDVLLTGVGATGSVTAPIRVTVRP